jgi:tetratricopeptide (TPR) repeat protein
MLTIKKRGGSALAIVAAACLVLTGCAPPGYRALHKGDRLVQSGKYAEAIEALKQATNLLAKEGLPAQAKARNLLGLAYHGASNAAGARECYEAALALDRNAAAEADYNLGCLELEQTNLTAAKDALTTYTSLRSRDLNGYMKLGMVSYRLAMRTPANADSARQVYFENARKSYDTSRRIKPTAEAWNNIAMIDLLRRPNPSHTIISNAVAEFRAALDFDTNYAPALFNLAVVYDPSGPYKYGDVQSATNAYLKYIALNPPPPHAKEIALLVSNMDRARRFVVNGPGQAPERPGTSVTLSSNGITIVRPTNPPARAPTPGPAQPPAPAPPPAAANQPPVGILPALAPSATNPPTVAMLSSRAPAPTNPPPVGILPASKPAEPPPPRPAAGGSDSNTLVLPSHSAPSPGSASAPPATENTAPATNVPLTSTAVRKPSLLARLFGAKPKPEEGGVETAASATGNAARVTPLPAPHNVLHYAAPAVSTNAGNRAEAERLVREGAAAEKDARWKNAMDSYGEAVRADPACYEACEALGMAAIKAEDYAVALEALHHALLLNSESANARYGYAWALERKDYLQDAANELEQLLARHPDETRAHLLLGNLYAQKLGQPDFARGHYKKVLEGDPRSDQAAAIRVWLQNNPEP